MSHDGVLSALLLVATVLVVFSRKMTVALIATSLFSMLLTLKYFILNAPDVAITEAALGAGLSTLIFLIGIRKTKERIPVIELLDYLQKDCFIRISATQYQEILKILTDHCLDEYPDEVRERVFREISSRKSFQEVNLGKGFALSHVRLDQLSDIHVCVGLLDSRIRYFSGPKVKTVFYIVLPNSRSRQYMSMMAKLARFLSDPEAQQVFESGDTEAIMEFLHRFEGA